jgi:DNA-binding NarL/FixJ family response regulator
VVDDQATFRDAASAVIGVTNGFELAGEAATGEEAVDLLGRRAADLVLMDVNMPGCGGIAAARQLRQQHPELEIVLLSTYEPSGLPPEVAISSLGYLSKGTFGPAALTQLWEGRAHRPADDSPA